MLNKPLLRVEHLEISKGGQILVQDLSFELAPAKTLAIVGESGSGKTLSSLALMGLLPSSLSLKGKLKLKDWDLQDLDEEAWSKLRGKEVAMVFQEPMSALNPSMKCGKQVAEILSVHGQKKGLKERVLDLFREVELPRVEEIYQSYPHQLSGGQKQRVVIAMAIANNPALLPGEYLSKAFPIHSTKLQRL